MTVVPFVEPLDWWPDAIPIQNGREWKPTVIPGSDSPPPPPDPFQPFPKIPRLFRQITITEKIDGTNAQIYITPDGRIYAASRNRYITPDSDNYGFASWVESHSRSLLELGPGRHYGEWWGAGIQRGYGRDTKKFSLFNWERWSDASIRPECCNVVPRLYEGIFSHAAIRDAMDALESEGSFAAPGFDKPEGIVIFHKGAGHMFKWTFDGDGHKG